MSELKKKLEELYKLQQIDNRILQNIRLIRQIERDEDPVQKRYRELKTRVESFLQDQVPFKEKAKELEHQIAMHKEKKKKIDEKLDDPKTDPKELQFVYKEREQYTKLIKTSEDEIVKLMLEVGSVDIKKRDFEEQLKEVEPEFKKVSEDRLANKEEYTKEIEKLKEERKAFKNFEDRNLLSLYSELQKTHDGMAIATIEDTDEKEVKVCTGCNVEVSKQTQQEVEYAENIVYCQRCGRILFKPGKSG